MHLQIPAAVAAYLQLLIVAAIIAVTAVFWNRWYIRRCRIKEFVKQMWIEQDSRMGKD